MPSFSLRRYDTQARVGLILSLASILGMLAVAALEVQNLKGMVIYYGTVRKAVIFGVGLVTVLLAVAGFAFGWNSAGQRRNDKPLLSWISFFVGGIVLCLTLVLLFFFYKVGEPATIL